MPYKPRSSRSVVMYLGIIKTLPSGKCNDINLKQTGHRLKTPAVWDMLLSRWIIGLPSLQCPTRNSSWTTETLKMKKTLSFETSGTTYPPTQHHIPEERNRLLPSENLKTCRPIVTSYHTILHRLQLIKHYAVSGSKHPAVRMYIWN